MSPDAPEMALPRSGNTAATGLGRIRREHADVRSAPRKARRWLLPSAMIPAFRQSLHPSTVAIPCRCAVPGRSPRRKHAVFALAPATNTAADTLPGAQPPQTAARQSTPIAKIAVSRETECFTMSAILMDTNPLPPTLSEPEQPASSESTAPAPSLVVQPRRENPLLEVFVGPKGLYPGTRWLIYLAMFGICLALLGLFMHFAHPQHGGPIWWGMVTQIG